MLGDPPGRSLLTLVAVTAVGEEVLFRGLLPALVRSVGFSSVGARRIAVLAFGVWHLPDAAPDGPLTAIGTFMLTSAAAAVVFEPLRRRTGSVFAPAAAHLLLNGCGLLLTEW
ncbi:MAG: CPBP family intramembrane metalloprotease [Actinomycetota bacterium]|nr:CPBP family intramembrane metalloprotease [Acidimicrobiia bacterium]MDQ3385545.1 CPBP family intramembrane metalloprotease [Actinomycetota bacterium]